MKRKKKAGAYVGVMETVSDHYYTLTITLEQKKKMAITWFFNFITNMSIDWKIRKWIMNSFYAVVIFSLWNFIIFP